MTAKWSSILQLLSFSTKHKIKSFSLCCNHSNWISIQCIILFKLKRFSTAFILKTYLEEIYKRKWFTCTSFILKSSIPCRTDQYNSKWGIWLFNGINAKFDKGKAGIFCRNTNIMMEITDMFIKLVCAGQHP